MQAPDASHASYSEDLALIHEAAQAASDIAMHYFGNDDALNVQFKQGDSPVSAGDFAVDDYLRKTLMQARPDYGWLSEETTDADPQQRIKAKRTFVVDPIDGTRAYISGGPCWCVSIAVVENDKPVAGVLACPVMKQTFAAARGEGATRNGVALAPIQDHAAAMAIAGRGALVSRLIEETNTGFTAHGHVPSLAYRIAMIADGRLGGTFIRANSHDWDIAAAALILHEAGGVMKMTGDRAVLLNGLNPKKPAMVAAHPALVQPMLRVADS